MPLPFILGAGAAAAGFVGLVNGAAGAIKAKEAKDEIEYAEMRHNRNIRRFEEANLATSKKMDELGKLELEILDSFNEFSALIEKIQNRPQFKAYNKDGVKLPEYNGEELKHVSVGASVLLGSLSGAAVGTAGGFAAAGATTSAVMALGTASTGTAISTLSGAALTNATLAALGGGALGSSAFAGGMALGSTILGAATLGVGLLVGGSIFEATGNKLSKQAEEAYSQMSRAEKTVDNACQYLYELECTAYKYYLSLKRVYVLYLDYLHGVSCIVRVKSNWTEYSDAGKLSVQNLVLLVGLLYKMCKVNLVNKADGNDINSVNKEMIENTLNNADEIVENTPRIHDVVLYDEVQLVYLKKGNEHYDREEYEEAYKCYKVSADSGNAAAMFYIGKMCLNGFGVDKDVKKACEWWDKAMLKEHARMLYFIGNRYFYGMDIDQDKEKGYKCYEKAALLGDKDALREMVEIHIKDESYNDDGIKTTEWAERAADHKVPYGILVKGLLCTYSEEETEKIKGKNLLTDVLKTDDEEAKEVAKRILREEYGVKLD